MQELKTTRNNADAAIITQEVLFLNNLPECLFKTLEYSFFIPHCELYESGTFLEVVGTLTPQSDKSFFQLKRLKVQTVTVLQPTRGSGKAWWRQVNLWSESFKAFLLEKIVPFLPFTQASLVAGMVFGGAASLPQELQTSFRVTGLTHVVSASGYNVSIVASLVLAIMGKIFPRQVAGIISLGVVWFYAVLAELVPPVMRATLMITLNILAAEVFFKQNPVWKSLLFACGIMLFFEPFYLFSLSFWLSTLATLGIIAILPLLESSEGIFSRLFTGELQRETESLSTKNNVVFRQPQPNIFLESFLVTVAAQSLTLPLVLMVFGEVSLLSFLTNTVLLWLTPIITLAGLGMMILGGILGVVPGLWEQVAPGLALGVWLPTRVFLAGVKWFGQLEWGVIKLACPWWAAIIWWGILILIILKKNQLK